MHLEQSDRNIRVCQKRQAPGQKVEERDTERINIRATIQTLPQRLLRRDIIGRPHQCLRRLRYRQTRGSIWPHDAGYSEVGQHDTTVTVEQNVRWLDVAMDASMLVRVIQG